MSQVLFWNYLLNAVVLISNIPGNTLPDPCSFPGTAWPDLRFFGRQLNA
jgi:hypothetical protein